MKAAGGDDPAVGKRTTGLSPHAANAADAIRIVNFAQDVLEQFMSFPRMQSPAKAPQLPIPATMNGPRRIGKRVQGPDQGNRVNGVTSSPSLRAVAPRTACVAGMFAPHPEMTSPWPVIVGALRDGRVVDVYNHVEGAPDFAKPELVSAGYAIYRWRKVLSIIEDQSYVDMPHRLALNYARYLCREWNTDAAPESQLMTFEIHFNVEWIPPPGGAKDVVDRTVWYHDCFGSTGSRRRSRRFSPS